MVLLPLLALWASATALSPPGSATPPSGASSDPSAILARAREVMGFDALQGRVLHLHAATAVEQPYQSDRTYPPFFSNFSTDETWFDAKTRVERTESRVVYPGNWPSSELLTLDDGEHAQLVRDGKAAFIPGVWGSDFIQTLDAPSQYAQEVMAAAARAGIQPERFAAEHLSLATWKALLQAQVVPTPK